MKKLKLIHIWDLNPMGNPFWQGQFVIEDENRNSIKTVIKTGFDHGEIAKLDGSPCDDEGEPIQKEMFVFLVKLQDPECGNECYCTVIAPNEDRAKKIAISGVPIGFTEVKYVKTRALNEETFCWDFHPALDGY